METSLTTRISEATEQRSDEATRSNAVPRTQHELGQFLTPKHVADFMASLFSIETPEIQLLDAGAGTGALTDAFVRRLCLAKEKPKRISVTAYELDGAIIDAPKFLAKAAKEIKTLNKEKRRKR